MIDDNQSEPKSPETEKTPRARKRTAKTAVKPKAEGKAKAAAKARPAGKAKKPAKLIIDPLGDPSDGEGRSATAQEPDTEAKTSMDAEPAAAAVRDEVPDGAAQPGSEDESHPEAAGSSAPEEIAEEPEPRPPAKLERLQKILAQAGVASRRHAEELITEGRVQVNGQVVTVLGTKADPERDHIRVDGKLLHGAERLRYFVLNKPKGYVTTVSDPEGRPTVMEFFAKSGERLYPVGRLDFQSEGLLLMTNDGDLANRLTKAASGVEKTYLVKVSGEPSEEQLNSLREGVTIERGRLGEGKVRTAAARIRQVRQGDNPWYEVVLIEGRNRELRKMFEEIGHHVEKIRRVGYGPLVLDVEPGKMRELDSDEVGALRRTAEGKLKPRALKTSHMLPREAGIPAGQRAAKFSPGKRQFGEKNYGRARGGGPPHRHGFSGSPRPDERRRDERPGGVRTDRPGVKPARFHSERSQGTGKADQTRGDRPAPAGRFAQRPQGMERKPAFHPRGEQPRQYEPRGEKPRAFRPRFERPANRSAGSGAGTGGRFDRRPPVQGPRKDDDRFRQKAGEGWGRRPDERRGERRDDQSPQNRSPKPSFGSRPSTRENRSEKPSFRGKAGSSGDRGKRPFGGRPGGPAKPGFKKKASWGKGPQGRKPGKPFSGGKPNKRRG